jgi:hypothetical protein
MNINEKTLGEWAALAAKNALLTLTSAAIAALVVSWAWNWSVVDYYHWTASRLDILHTAAVLFLARVVRFHITRKD